MKKSNLQNIERKILGDVHSSKSVIINNVGGMEGYMTIATGKPQAEAEYFKSEYPQIKRLVDISTDSVNAIYAAYATASGVFDGDNGKLADNVYDVKRSDVFLRVLTRARTEKALDKAALELVRESYGKVNIPRSVELLQAASDFDAQVCTEALAKSIGKVEADYAVRSDDFKYRFKYDPESPEALCAEILRDKPRRRLLQLPTGWGKTSRVLQPVIEKYLVDGKKVVVISHRRSIIKNLNIDGLVHYEDVAPRQMETARGLKVVVNSINSEKFKEFLSYVDLVVVDEAAQVINHIFEGSVAEREEVWKTFKRLLKSGSRSAILADADINDECLALLNDHNGIVSIFSKKQSHGDNKIHLGQLDQVRAMALESIGSSKKVLIACDIAKDARALGKAAEKLGVQALVITAESASWPDQAAFISNPNTTEHAVVIYSPAITSALSITSGHFDEHYGLFEGSVTPREAVQMLRRNRTTKEFTVGIRNPQNRKEEVADFEFNASDKTDFDVEVHAHRKRNAWLRDNILFTLPREMHRQGFQVEQMERDDEKGIQGFKANSSARKALKKDSTQKLLSAKQISETEAQKIFKNGSASEDEYFAALNAQARAALKKNELTVEDAKFWGDGVGKVKLQNYRNLYFIGFNEFRCVVREVFRGMQSGKWRPEDSVSAYDRINKAREQAILAGFRLPKNSPNISDRSKQGAISEIMAMHGLKTRRKDGGEKVGYYYIIDPKSLEQMQGYTGS
ncbi:DEAD/DEAH box helicase family protein [Pseudomonas juntendi]|uniref:DEAD/DEAH box helicase family protein n=1 Tax=Pseudomonas juntendi TaxID=2666183 RepID=UPI001F2198B7|nr:DEAD/DEAH box helicase family protein [Pseudomonas juntendi]MCO7057143.1 DEAD/DEAH box helicase family protein [Pseudomonas juntendi]UJM14028.1 DEAD/DEAH box helicase family protein [Pseudomonas juntendi]